MAKIIDLHHNNPAEEGTPQTLQLPPPPSPGEIQRRRKHAFLTIQQAAELCGVAHRTWKRWENGEARCPQAIWGWFQIMSGPAEIPQAGPEWEGWNFYKGRLYAPSGWGGFHPGHLHDYTLQRAQNHVLEKENRELKEEVRQLKNPQLFEERQKALGQLDMIGMMLSQLIHEYEISEDELLQQVSRDALGVMTDTCRLKVDIIRRHVATA